MGILDGAKDAQQHTQACMGRAAWRSTHSSTSGGRRGIGASWLLLLMRAAASSIVLAAFLNSGG